MQKILPWKILKETEIYAATPWISLSVQQVRLPTGQVVDDYHQIKLPDYTVIFAETIDGNVIVERQYKHGVGQVTLVLPAGSIEAGESPLEAAQRELLEETGYSSTDWQLLGSFVANGNYGCGTAHFFIARHAHQVAEPNSGDLEDIQIILMKSHELVEALRQGHLNVLSSAAAIALATNPLLWEAES